MCFSDLNLCYNRTMRKKIFIVGNSAKSYALTKKLSEQHDIYVTPKNDTLKEFATCLDIREDSIDELLDFAMENDMDMTIAVSDVAIKSGIADKFNDNKVPIFAPQAKSMDIIADKTIAKKTLYKLRIPTPKFGIFDKQNIANDYLKNQKIPFVIKNNDSNSALVITSLDVAKNIIESWFIEKNKKIIVEDYVYGTSFSFYAITDGYKALPFGSSINYKYSLDGDGGQLTSGMGSCVPNYKLSFENEYFIMDNVIYPTLEYLQNTNSPYLGIIGINGIITDNNEISILGWKTFMEDSDSAGILNSIDDDLYMLFESCIIGSFSDEVTQIRTNNKQSVSVTLSCKVQDSNENVIQGLDKLDEDTIITYYPTVIKNKYLEYEAKYGSVMTLTSSASSLAKAGCKVYEELENIDYTGIYYRKDICKVNK